MWGEGGIKGDVTRFLEKGYNSDLSTLWTTGVEFQYR